ncbi:hypothetical protein D3P08_16455 [Paenibacillus nanensis]|uniref:Uncharacterized protein n=1 Tax=Paenibacillus nanensis TaxID=393251 RepID=A0A3A1UWE2_9BACL|nr:hypothetical protein D3P08_16455 [Paenibacillus nanensis]
MVVLIQNLANKLVHVLVFSAIYSILLLLFKLLAGNWRLPNFAMTNVLHMAVIVILGIISFILTVTLIKKSRGRDQ